MIDAIIGARSAIHEGCLAPLRQGARRLIRAFENKFRAGQFRNARSAARSAKFIEPNLRRRRDKKRHQQRRFLRVAKQRHLARAQRRRKRPA